MRLALYLLAALAFLGAFDTIYYHEWRAKLPALGVKAKSELRLHALRDFVYAVLFGTLPGLAWQGWRVLLLCGLFLTEIVLTLWDFVVEYWVRKQLGGLYQGESVMHGLMGIVYGAMLANIIPTLKLWWHEPSALTVVPSVGAIFRWMMTLMAVGVALSGVRDLYAATGLPGSAWPWSISAVDERSTTRAGVRDG
jgi:hypothetical protein